jgi:hypothetical protein
MKKEQKTNQKEKKRKKRKITKLCLFLDLLSQMCTFMYVIHHHKKKREREVEHVTVLKTTTQMRTKKKRETMLNVYERTIFALLCSKKRKNRPANIGIGIIIKE